MAKRATRSRQAAPAEAEIQDSQVEDLQDETLDETVGELADEQLAVDETAEEDLSESIPSEPSAPASFFDRARVHGLPVPETDDEDEALRNIAQQLQAGQQAQQYMQQMAPYQQQFAQWLQEQEAARQPEPEQPSHWQAPEWNPQWLTQVDRDADGNLVPVPSAGGSLETVNKVMRYLQYRQDQQEKFWNNPFEYMQGFVDQRAEERARGLVQEELARYREQQEATQFVQANRSWLFDYDDQGQPKQGQNGQPVLSGEGQMFYQFLQQASELGMGPEQQKVYATNMIQAYRQGRQGASHSEDTAQKKVKQLQKAAGYTAQRGASLNQAADGNGVPGTQNENLSLAEMLKQNLRAAGITDEDLQ